MYPLNSPLVSLSVVNYYIHDYVYIYKYIYIYLIIWLYKVIQDYTCNLIDIFTRRTMRRPLIKDQGGVFGISKGLHLPHSDDLWKDLHHGSSSLLRDILSRWQARMCSTISQPWKRQWPCASYTVADVLQPRTSIGFKLHLWCHWNSPTSPCSLSGGASSPISLSSLPTSPCNSCPRSAKFFL